MGLDAIRGPTIYPFRWWFRPEEGVTPAIQIGQVDEELPLTKLSELLREIDDRHWRVIRQLLIEAKVKGEAMMRSDDVISNPGLLAYWNGCVSYADYALANFEGLRSGQFATDGDENSEPMR